MAGFKRRYKPDRTRRVTRAEHHNDGDYRIVFDPSNTFFVGNAFDKENVEATLKTGNWPIGLQLRQLSTQKVFRVVEAEGVQRLEEVYDDKRKAETQEALEERNPA